jgi:hypothetical protein
MVHQLGQVTAGKPASVRREAAGPEWKTAACQQIPTQRDGDKALTVEHPCALRGAFLAGFYRFRSDPPGAGGTLPAQEHRDNKYDRS